MPTQQDEAGLKSVAEYTINSTTPSITSVPGKVCSALSRPLLVSADSESGYVWTIVAQSGDCEQTQCRHPNCHTGGVSPYRIGTAKDLLAAKNGDKNVWRQRAPEWI